MASFEVNTPIFDMSSAEYHSTKGTWSSSQLKTMLESPKLFFQKYIECSIEKEEAEAFDTGTYFHTGILEPHKLKEDCAIFPGKIRSGEKWESFKKKHKGKALLTESMEEQGKQLIANVKASPISMGYLKNIEPEVSMFLSVAVDWKNKKIYAPDQELVLSKNGWVRFKGKIPKDCIKLILKVRADGIKIEEGGYILDLKSTSSDAESESEMQKCTRNYSYDLSAALYLDVFSAGLEKDIREFYWIYSSKKYNNAKTWSAEKYILQGRSKYAKAVHLLAKNIDLEWKFKDELGILIPEPWEERQWEWDETPEVISKTKTTKKEEFDDAVDIL